MDSFYGQNSTNWSKQSQPPPNERIFYPPQSVPPSTTPGILGKKKGRGFGPGIYQEQTNFYADTQHYGSGDGSFYSGFGYPSAHQAPSSLRRARVGTYPRKTGHGFGMDGFSVTSSPPSKKPKYSTAGKTAAMILNELYPEYKDKCVYKTLTVSKLPRFECTLAIKDKSYTAEASSKKAAKQLACESALKELRPDITIDVSVAEEEAKKLADYGSFAPGMCKSDGPAEVDGDGLTAAERAAKKRADHMLMTANSLHDYFLRLCRDRETATKQKYCPQFTFVELPPVVTGKGHNTKRFQCTLNMPEQNKIYTHEGVGKAPTKNSVIRKALVDVFQVGHEQMKELERRAMNLKPGKPIQVLTQALNFYDRTMRMEVETTDGKPVDSKSRYVCKITLDNNKEIVGPEESTKQKARDVACVKVITEELELCMPDAEDATVRKAATILSPPYALYQLMLKQDRKKAPDLVYRDPEDISESMNKPPKFKCTLIVNSTDCFEGIGQSKKAAKSAAAEQALKKLFNFDTEAPNAMEMLSVKKARRDEEVAFCNDLCLFVREQYEAICQQQACPITTHISAFVLVLPDGSRHMIALGAGRNSVIDGQCLIGAQGNVLLHMESAVLARRAFLLYLQKQLERRGDSDCMIERSPLSNKFRLKTGYKLVLYTSFPPNLCANNDLKLTCYASGGRLTTVPSTVQTFEEIISSGCVNVMSIADKMLKWNHVGIQGALLSYMFDPIYIDYLCIGSPICERVVMQTVLLRSGDACKNALKVKSLRAGIVSRGEIYHNWVASFGTVERLDPFTGRTVTGSPSRLCKSELFESWARLQRALSAEQCKLSWSCAEAKKNQLVYQQNLEKFIAQLKQNGLGEWQRKDVRVDNFQLASFDE